MLGLDKYDYITLIIILIHCNRLLVELRSGYETIVLSVCICVCVCVRACMCACMRASVRVREDFKVV